MSIDDTDSNQQIPSNSEIEKEKLKNDFYWQKKPGLIKMVDLSNV